MLVLIEPIFAFSKNIFKTANLEKKDSALYNQFSGRRKMIVCVDLKHKVFVNSEQVSSARIVKDPLGFYIAFNLSNTQNEKSDYFKTEQEALAIITQLNKKV